MILVTGATGQFGSKTVDHLLKKGVNPSEISVLVRDALKATDLKEKGVHIQEGDYTNHNSMVQAFVGDKVAETGTILFPAGEGKASWTLREELAEAAAHVLITEGHENKTYTLTNTESVGFKAIAQEVSEALDKEIDYQSPDVNEFKVRLEKAGVPEMYIGMFVMWGTALAQKTMDKEEDTLTNFLGRKPMAVSQFIERVYG